MFQNTFMQYVVLKCPWLHHFDYSFVCIIFVFLQKQSLMYTYQIGVILSLNRTY